MGSVRLRLPAHAGGELAPPGVDSLRMPRFVSSPPVVDSRWLSRRWLLTVGGRVSSVWGADSVSGDWVISGSGKPFGWQDTSVAEGVPPEQIRVSDVDRKAVQERLHSAHAEGLITLAEFDSRVGAAWQAATRGELAKITADLPAATPPPAPRAPAPRRRRRGPTALRVLNAIWLSLAALNLVIWGLVCLTTGQLIYPWWLWVAVPPGAVLGTLWFTVGGRRDSGGNAALPPGA